MRTGPPTLKKPPIPGRRRGRPKGIKGRGKNEPPKNTGGGLPFFNPYGGKTGTKTKTKGMKKEYE